LVENGLIQYEEGKHTYRTTEKGIDNKGREGEGYTFFEFAKQN
jgi:predicted transcriptional regulator